MTDAVTQDVIEQPTYDYAILDDPCWSGWIAQDSLTTVIKKMVDLLAGKFFTVVVVTYKEPEPRPGIWSSMRLAPRTAESGVLVHQGVAPIVGGGLPGVEVIALTCRWHFFSRAESQEDGTALDFGGDAAWIEFDFGVFHITCSNTFGQRCRYSFVVEDHGRDAGRLISSA